MPVTENRAANDVERERAQTLPSGNSIAGRELLDGNISALGQNRMITREFDACVSLGAHPLGRSIAETQNPAGAERRLVPTSHTARDETPFLVERHD